MNSIFEGYPSTTECPAFQVCAVHCWDEELVTSSASTCFRLAWSFIAIGVLLIGVAESRGHWMGRVKKYFDFGSPRPKPEHQDVETRGEDNNDRLDPDSIRNMADNGFLTTDRTRDNFMKNSSDPTLQLPNAYGPEYANKSISQSVFPLSGFSPTDVTFDIIRSSLFRSCWMGSLGWGLICSSVSTVLWNLLHYESTCYPNDTYVRDWIRNIAKSFDLVRSDFDFYPTFLLVGYIAFVANRWREFLANCHSIQGSIHDTALLCGGAMLKPPSVEIRSRLFNIYRYLNLIHALCYKSISPCMGPLDLETDFVYKLKLLTEDELDELLPMENKILDTVIGWLSNEVSRFLAMDGVQHEYVGVELASCVTAIRMRTSKHHQLFVRDNPNLYLNLMLLIVNMLVSSVLVSYPFSLLVETPAFLVGIPCFQWLTLFGVFLLVLAYRTALALLVRLRNPFSWTSDRIKVDNLLASTDRSTFAMLRSSFQTAVHPQHLHQAQHLRQRRNRNSEFFQSIRRSQGHEHIMKLGLARDF